MVLCTSYYDNYFKQAREIANFYLCPSRDAVFTRFHEQRRSAVILWGQRVDSLYVPQKSSSFKSEDHETFGCFSKFQWKIYDHITHSFVDFWDGFRKKDTRWKYHVKRFKFHFSVSGMCGYFKVDGGMRKNISKPRKSHFLCELYSCI